MVISRLVYRKGVDLLLGIVPRVCQRYPHINFIIGGDGPKRVALEEVIEKVTHVHTASLSSLSLQNQLHDRVELLGSVPHASVKDVLRRGHVFLNCSLTEAFCIAIVEAAACGLLVVSTNVGGVTEVFPPGVALLAEPRVDALVEGIAQALLLLPTVCVCHPRPYVSDVTHSEPHALHAAVKGMYDWNDVALRTEQVYTAILRDRPAPASLHERITECATARNAPLTCAVAGGHFRPPQLCSSVA